MKMARPVCAILNITVRTFTRHISRMDIDTGSDHYPQ
jgi:hypothetical protein